MAIDDANRRIEEERRLSAERMSIAEAAYTAELENSTSVLSAARRSMVDASDIANRYAAESQRSLTSIAKLNSQLLTTIANSVRENAMARDRIRVAELYLTTVRESTRQETIMSDHRVAMANEQLGLHNTRMGIYQAEIQSIQLLIDANEAVIATEGALATATSAHIDTVTSLIHGNAILMDEQLDNIATQTALRAATDARIASLDAAIVLDESQRSAVLATISSISARIAAGEALSDAELVYSAGLGSEHARLSAAIKANSAALATENAHREHLTAVIDSHARTLEAIDIAADRLHTSELDLAEEFQDSLATIQAFGRSTIALTDQQNEISAAMGEVQNDVLAAAAALASEQHRAEEQRLGGEHNIARATLALQEARDDAVATEIKGQTDILQSMATTLRSIANFAKQIVGGIRTAQQEYGLTAGTATSVLVGNMMSSIRSYMESFQSLGGSEPVSRKDIGNAQSAFQNEFGGVITSNSAKVIAEQAKALGVSSDAIANARRVFMTQTKGDLADAIRAQEQFRSTFTARGLTSKDAFAAMSRHSDIIAKSGIRFADSFTRAAVEAKKIGIDLNKIDQIGDNIIGDFEGFLENSSTLGAMGFNIDANKLAQLSEMGDTGALFEQLRSELASSGKDITNLRRSEQLALSQTFGMSMSEFQRLASGKGGSGEKTIEELAVDDNSLLTRLVRLTESLLIPTLIGMNGLLTLIAASTALSAAATMGVAAPIIAAIAPIAAAVVGVASLLGGVSYGMSEYTKGNKGKGAAIVAGSALAGGALTGAGVGAAYGLAGGPIGAVGGAAIGAVGGAAYGAYSLLSAPKAEGGMVEGAGTATSDNVLTPTSPGEFVVNAKAVQGYGANFLESINKQHFTPQAPPVIQNNVQFDSKKLEAKLDMIVAAIGSMGIHMNGEAVGKILVNSAEGASVSSTLRGKSAATY